MTDFSHASHDGTFADAGSVGVQASEPAVPALRFSRQIFESLIVLAIAVLSFREFAAEGYLISTGSMAPTLLGYHKQLECPQCRCRFAAGVAPHDSASTTRIAMAQDLYGDEPAGVSRAVCPNCGFDEIETLAVPENEGDQLMVHKHAYQFRDPRRWEVVVFRNPADPLEVYVKRVVGRPGDTVSLRDGDVYINGTIQPKPIETQRAMRILVDDDTHRPDPTTLTSVERPQPRWVPAAVANGWSRAADRLEFTPHDSEPTSLSGEIAWIDFRHWIAADGHHVTSTRLVEWPEGIGPPPPAGRRLSYDPHVQTLSCVGVLPASEVERWTQATGDAAFQTALVQLAAASHEAPVIDDYAYNLYRSSDATFVVRDLMVSFDVAASADSRLAVAINDGRRRYTTEFDFASGEAVLHSDQAAGPLRRASFLPTVGRDARIEVSLMDGQLLVAYREQLLFEPVVESRVDPEAPAPRRPLHLGAAGGHLAISSLRVDRDVYYTPKSDDRLFRTLADDEFFVLGDNSPVSVDSRCWEEPAIRRETLIGKPLFVHLPSQQARLSLLGWNNYVRIPDYTRVRYIR